MTINQMRERMSHVYAGPIWRSRVQGMSDNQVVAIYKRMERDGVFEKLKKQARRKKKEPICEQLTIFDLLKDEGTNNAIL